jgi:hypothetical protein
MYILNPFGFPDEVITKDLSQRNKPLKTAETESCLSFSMSLLLLSI